MIFVKIGRGYVENISQYVYYTRNTTPFGVVFLHKNVILFFNFLQTTSAAYGYYPYLFPFLLSSIHHMYPYLMIIGCTDIGISCKSIRTALRSV